MLEISTSGLMSGDGKRGGLLGAQPPRPSSTLLIQYGNRLSNCDLRYWERAQTRALPATVCGVVVEPRRVLWVLSADIRLTIGDLAPAQRGQVSRAAISVAWALTATAYGAARPVRHRSRR